MSACMGGWCRKRDKCALYVAQSPAILERLCEPGQLDSFEPLKVLRGVGEWERKASLAPMRRADVFDFLTT